MHKKGKFLVFVFFGVLFYFISSSLVYANIARKFFGGEIIDLSTSGVKDGKSGETCEGVSGSSVKVKLSDDTIKDFFIPSKVVSKTGNPVGVGQKILAGYAENFPMPCKKKGTGTSKDGKPAVISTVVFVNAVVIYGTSRR